MVAAVATAAAGRALEQIPANRRILDAAKSDEAIKHQLPNGFVIVYSAQYSDDTHVYRHIQLSKKMWRDVTRLLSLRADRLLTYTDVVEKLGISMSSDWRHYLSNRRDSTLFFKRPRRG